MESSTYQHSKTTVFFYRLSFVVYILGLPNFWLEDLKLSKTFVKFYDKFTKFNNLLIYFLIIFEFGSFFTQENLSVKQKSNLLLYAISHPMLCMFRVMMARLKEKVRKVMYSLTVELKRVHNDPEVERQMLASTYMYMFAVFFSCLLSMIMYAAEAIWEVVRDDLTFTTLVTAYPNVHDKSTLADVVRALCFITWWIFLTRIIGVYILVIPLTTCLSHQYKNLQSYFISLGDIFERNDLSQTEKEDKYEAGFKVGIQLHSDTLRCTQQTQEVCRGVFSGQILFNMILLVLLMAQMAVWVDKSTFVVAHILELSENSSIQVVFWEKLNNQNSERTLVNLCAAVFTASAVLITTGFYMWNAGDVTVEASHLATAIYLSGWYHNQCQASARIRKLVVITMLEAQRPVVLKGFGYIDLSYQSYLRIVKASYSVFSVIY